MHNKIKKLVQPWHMFILEMKLVTLFSLILALGASSCKNESNTKSPLGSNSYKTIFIEEEDE